jgi:hypothetical protein
MHRKRELDKKKQWQRRQQQQQLLLIIGDKGNYAKQLGRLRAFIEGRFIQLEE